MNSKEELARREGMSFALNFAKEHGLEVLEEECKRRGAYNLPLALSNKQLKDIMDSASDTILHTIMVLSACVLRDEFEFGKNRIQRYLDRLQEKCDCYILDYCTMKDHEDMLADELDIHIDYGRKKK